MLSSIESGEGCEFRCTVVDINGQENVVPVVDVKSQHSPLCCL